MKVTVKLTGKTWYGWLIWRYGKVKVLMPPGIFSEDDKELEVTIFGRSSK